MNIFEEPRRYLSTKYGTISSFPNLHYSPPKYEWVLFDIYENTRIKFKTALEFYFYIRREYKKAEILAQKINDSGKFILTNENGYLEVRAPDE